MKYRKEDEIRAEKGTERERERDIERETERRQDWRSSEKKISERIDLSPTVIFLVKEFYLNQYSAGEQ